MTDTKVANTAEDTTRFDGATMLPAVDVIEDVAGITLYADLPGVSKNKLNVRVEADALSIEGEVDLPVAAEMEATHAEVYLPRYHRAFALGQELDRDKVTAEFKHGVLKLHIPKAEHAKPRKVAINVN
ncbi:MAG: heat-shock protein [Betaproteobacteria bacterium RIFCSPLOWO2_02_FULL_63_19]|nr:MAG: heat-shock protein [Betaproteobacteria bacterium RIFCSPLOWO2_02_FULL_63_19]